MKHKNTVVIMSDEHDPRIMGCAGHPLVHTPHLDALAARGVRFSNAYTPSPICVPARAAFATGHRVHDIGHWDNALPYIGEVEGWGHVLQKAGVRTASIGKLHYRNEEDPVGFDEEHLPMHVVGGHGMVWASIRDPYVSRFENSRMLGQYIGPGESSYTTYDRAITETTVQWLKEAAARDEPFVLYVGLVAPHFPLVVPQEYFDLYPAHTLPAPKLLPRDGHALHPWVQAYADLDRTEERFKDEDERLAAFSAYYGLCSYLDHNVGQIMQALDATGLSDNTTVIYTSDHGDNLGARGLWGKSTLYRESVGVPMIIAGPGISPGVNETPVDLLDLYPTILESAEIDPAPHMGQRPGSSLLQVAAAGDDLDRVIFSEYHAVGSNTGAFMVRKGRWKYHYYVRFEPELFDVEADPEESRNLAQDPAYHDVLVAMERALREICDPEAVDVQAKVAQEKLVDSFGGRAKAFQFGAPGATPAPV